MNPENLQLLVIRAMPFGKYKGRLIADLTGRYLRDFVCEGVPKINVPAIHFSPLVATMLRGGGHRGWGYWRSVVVGGFVQAAHGTKIT